MTGTGRQWDWSVAGWQTSEFELKATASAPSASPAAEKLSDASQTRVKDGGKS